MSFLAELKRRNVVKVATVYLIASWLLLQVTDVLSSLLSLPAVIGTSVVVLLAVGFFPVLIFAWVFELTPEGLKREADLPPGDATARNTGRRINIVIALLAVAAIGAVVLDRVLPETADTPAAARVDARAAPAAAGEKPSIAVLPFANFSGAKEDDYFSDGLADTLLHHLAQVPGLTVIARNSSFQFKGENLDVRDIGQRLGVGNVLEGSVQRYGDKLRVIAQLARRDQRARVAGDRQGGIPADDP